MTLPWLVGLQCVGLLVGLQCVCLLLEPKCIWKVGMQKNVYMYIIGAWVFTQARKSRCNLSETLAFSRNLFGIIARNRFKFISRHLFVNPDQAASIGTDWHADQAASIGTVWKIMMLLIGDPITHRPTQ